MSEGETTGAVGINKPAVILIIGIAALVSLAPALFVLGRSHFLMYSTILALLIATRSVLRAKHTSEGPPGFLPFFLAGVEVASTISVLGLWMLVLYGLIYGASWLINLVASWFGAQWQPNFDLLAFYPTIILLGGLGIAVIPEFVDMITKQLYPTTTGTKHAFYELVTQRRSILTKWVIVAVLILILFISFAIIRGEPGSIFYILLQFYIFCVGFPLYQSDVQRTLRIAVTSQSRSACSKLLKAAGYKVIVSPRTGNATMDPLLTGIDLFAYTDERALAIELKHTLVDRKPIVWTDALEVRNAARLLGGAKMELEITAQEVEPVLILIGVKADEILRDFAKEESVGLVELDDKEVSEIIGLEKESELRNRASSLLGQIPTLQAKQVSAHGDVEGNA